MGGGIDPARKPRDDHEAGLPELAGQTVGELDPGGGGIARADHGDHRPFEHGALAAHRDERGRIVDHLQPPGIPASPSAT